MKMKSIPLCMDTGYKVSLSQDRKSVFEHNSFLIQQL